MVLFQNIVAYLQQTPFDGFSGGGIGVVEVDVEGENSSFQQLTSH